MLPRQHRLLLRKDPTFFSTAHRASSKSLTCFYREAEKFSAAVIVPKKIAPLAVDRHTIKRLIYQSLENVLLKDSNHQTLPLSLVLSVKKNHQVNNLTDWQTEIEDLLIKIKS